MAGGRRLLHGKHDGSLNVLAGDLRTVSDLQPVGCTPGSDGGTLAAGQGEPITFTGYLASSHSYDAHDPTTGPKAVIGETTAAVAVQSMPFDQSRFRGGR